MSIAAQFEPKEIKEQAEANAQARGLALELGCATLNLDPEDLKHPIFRQVRRIDPPTRRYRSYTNSAMVIFRDDSQTKLLNVLARIAFGEALDFDLYEPQWIDCDWRNARSSNISLCDKRSLAQAKPATRSRDEYYIKNRERIRQNQRLYYQRRKAAAQAVTQTAESVAAAPPTPESPDERFARILNMLEAPKTEALPSATTHQAEQAPLDDKGTGLVPLSFEELALERPPR